MRDKKEQDFLNELGKKIRVFRADKGWSQERLGFKSNLDRTYIGGIERGEENPSILVLKKIADAFEVPMEKLFTKNKE